MNIFSSKDKLKSMLGYNDITNSFSNQQKTRDKNL